MPCRPSVRPSGRARFVLPGPHLGLLRDGNIDLFRRPTVRQGNGWATVFSRSFGFDEGEILLPRVIRLNGKWIVGSDSQAIQAFRRTGEHLGIFDTAGHANLYGERLHQQQARIYCLNRRF